MTSADLGLPKVRYGTVTATYTAAETVNGAESAHAKAVFTTLEPTPTTPEPTTPAPSPNPTNPTTPTPTNTPHSPTPTPATHKPRPWPGLSLPVTGFPALMLGAVTVLFIVLGAGLVLAARTRRSR